MSYTIDQLNAIWHDHTDGVIGRESLDAVIMDAIGKATKIADLRAEIERLRAVEAAALAQSEDVQLHWLSPAEAAGLRDEAARLRSMLREALFHNQNAATMSAALDTFADRRNWGDQDGNDSGFIAWLGDNEEPWTIAQIALGIQAEGQ